MTNNNAAAMQVLPPDVMLLAEPSPEDLLEALEEALVRVPELDPVQQHKKVGACSSCCCALCFA